MFQFTNQYATTTLGQAGGVALYISEFLSQFYVVIGIGPVIAALILTGIAFFSFLFLKKIALRDDLPFVGLLPWLSLFINKESQGSRPTKGRSSRNAIFFKKRKEKKAIPVRISAAITGPIPITT